MILRVVPIADNSVQIQIDKEDYSIADIVHRELLNVKHVKFAGVPPPHPLIKTLTIQVHTDGTLPAKVLREALELSQKRVSELLSVALDTFPRTPKTAPERVERESITASEEPSSPIQYSPESQQEQPAPEGA